MVKEVPVLIVGGGYGSDFPYVRPQDVAAFTAARDEFVAIDHDAVNSRNAEKLLG